jgi:hypothetical protein
MPELVEQEIAMECLQEVKKQNVNDKNVEDCVRLNLISKIF